MSRYIKLVLGMLALYIGLALLPYVNLPYGRFDWESYADAYVDTPTSTPTETLTPTHTPTGTLPTPTDTSTPTKTSTPTPSLPTVALLIYPNAHVAAMGEIFTLDIVILSGIQPVDGAQVYVDFDPAYLAVVDAAGLLTNQIIPGPEFPAIFENLADNALGRINYVAGDPVAPWPTGIIHVARMRFKALAPVAGTLITFHFTPPRQTKIVYEGTNLLGPWAPGVVAILPIVLTPTPTATATPSGTGTVHGYVNLQARPAKPHPSWQTPLVVTFYAGGHPVYAFTPTTDPFGHFMVTGLAPGLYDIHVKNMHTLSNQKLNVPILPGDNNVYLGTLVEGDASNDDLIDILDFSILRTVFGTGDPRADFDQDGIVDILDFSIFRTNFGQSGGIIVAGEEEKT